MRGKAPRGDSAMRQMRVGVYVTLHAVPVDFLRIELQADSANAEQALLQEYKEEEEKEEEEEDKEKRIRIRIRA